MDSIAVYTWRSFGGDASIANILSSSVIDVFEIKGVDVSWEIPSSIKASTVSFLTIHTAMTTDMKIDVEDDSEKIELMKCGKKGYTGDDCEG